MKFAHLRTMLACWLTSVAALAIGSGVRADEVATKDAEFFEQQIRPLLIAQCTECHGDRKQEAKLRLDSREALLAGGDSGPALVPGDPEKSLLIAAIRQTGDLQMPPESKLKAEQIAAIERWVKLGAPWPKAPLIAKANDAARRLRIGIPNFKMSPALPPFPPFLKASFI